MSFTALKSWTSLHFLQLALRTGNKGLLQQLGISINTPALSSPSIVNLIPSSASGFIGYWVFHGSLASGFIFTQTGLADLTNPTSVSYCDHTSVGIIFSISQVH